MPTSQDEAKRIVEISQEYIPLDKMTQLFIRLDEEVGKHTANDSLKQSLRMMRLLVDPPLAPPPLWLRPAFWLLVAIHFVLVVGMAASFLILPFYAPWYVALPLCAFIWFFATSRVDCKLTDLENLMRRRLGMKRIGGFVGHYMLKPAKKLLLRLVHKKI
jgi:hypothetical protein